MRSAVTACTHREERLARRPRWARRKKTGDSHRDLDKSESNKCKHGIDFEEEAKALWNDLSAYEVDAITIDEPRTKRVGNCQGKLWAAIFTMRGERIRIISVRRAHGDEAKRYQND